MQKGDISNVVPQRLIVTWDALTEDVVVPKKRFGIITTGHTVERRLVSSVLLTLWNFSEAVPVTVELTCFGVDIHTATERLDALDARGGHPITQVSTYLDIYDLINDLPYRPDVVGVLDVEENTARYGGRGITLDYLTRII